MSDYGIEQALWDLNELADDGDLRVLNTLKAFIANQDAKCVRLHQRVAELEELVHDCMDDIERLAVTG